MTAHRVPSTFDVLATLVRVTLRRLTRGRAVWACVGIALLPFFVASLFNSSRHLADVVITAQMFVLVLLPPVFVAASIGEEIEERTTTYLWSRPIPRWSIIIGKLIALAPIATLLVVGGWVAAIMAASSKPPSGDSIVAFAAGGIAISIMSAGLATIAPKQGMVLAIIYLVIIDLAIGILPASLQNVSVTRQVTLMTGLSHPVEHVRPLITMACIAGVWLVVGLLRLRRRES